MIDPNDRYRPRRAPMPLDINLPQLPVPAQIAAPFQQQNLIVPPQPQQVAPAPMQMPEPPLRSVLKPEDRIRQMKQEQPRW